MANTLKFGNGEWYGKKDTILAYNDENNNYKPLPFDFSRDGSATVVNKDGLIETVGSGEPRIDYKDDSKGALLLEPSRSNKITYSDLQSQVVWYSGSAWTVSDNSQISPQGILNASSLTEDLTNGFHSGYYNSVIDNGYTGDYTISCFAKYNGRYLALSPKSATERTIFDLQNGSIYQLGDGGVTAKIDNYGNGWYRCSVTCSFSNENVNFEHLLANNNSLQYQGDGVSGIYIYGCQAEAGSYPTSYIQTQGSSVTRLADSCVDAGNDQVFNDNEGVIYVETQPFIDGDFTSVYISLSNNTTGNDFITIQHRNSGQLRVYAGNFSTIIFLQNIDMSENLKIALQYKNITDFKLYVNGISYPIYSTPTNSAFVGLNTFDFKLRGSTSGYWLGQVKEAKYFNTALTDQELQALTSN